jgi:hypothetical protein
MYHFYVSSLFLLLLFDVFCRKNSFGQEPFPPKNRVEPVCLRVIRKTGQFSRQIRLLYCFALLVSDSARSLAGRLAGRLALAAAALSGGSFQISLVDCCDMLQKEHLFQ